MPQAIAGFIFQAAFAIGGSVGVALATAAPFLALAVTVGIIAGVSALLGAIFGPKRPGPSDGQQTVRQSVGSRVRGYGVIHTGGLLTFFESRNGTLAQVVTLGTGREGSEILEHRINDTVVTVSGGVVTDASYHGAVTIYTRNGEPDQTAIAELTSQFPEWTSDHRQRGCAHAAILAAPVKQEQFSEVYNGRMPAYTQVRKACCVYDPRKDSTRAGGSGAHRLDDPATWEWSDNGALIVADYIAHPDGFGAGYDNVDWDDLMGEADIADQLVDTASGDTIARWRLWGSYKLAVDERRQVQADMLAAIDGFSWQDAAFKFRLRVGRYEAPTVTITDDHIIAMAPRFGPDADKRSSSVRVVYTEAAIGYREQESNAAAVPGANEDPNTAPSSVQAYWVPHHNQAMRIAKLAAAQLGQRWHVPVTLNLFGLNLLGERFCRFDSAQFGVAFDARIERLRLRFATNTVEATLSEVRAEDWDFDYATEEGTPPATGDAGTTTVTIETPEGLTVSAVQIATSSGSAVVLNASWSAGRADLTYEVRYRPTAGGDWVMMTVDNTNLTATSGPVSTGVEYEVTARSLTMAGRPGFWASYVTITPIAATTLSAPSSLAASGAAGSASISFRNPTDATLAYVRVYGSSTGTFGSAVQIGSDIVGGLGEVITITDTGLSAGTRTYWARAFDGSGGSSSLAGPVTATVT